MQIAKINQRHSVIRFFLCVLSFPIPSIIHFDPHYCSYYNTICLMFIWAKHISCKITNTALNRADIMIFCCGSQQAHYSLHCVVIARQTWDSLQILCVFSIRTEWNGLIPKIQLSREGGRECKKERECCAEQAHLQIPAYAALNTSHASASLHQCKSASRICNLVDARWSQIIWC